MFAKFLSLFGYFLLGLHHVVDEFDVTIELLDFEDLDSFIITIKSDKERFVINTNNIEDYLDVALQDMIYEILNLMSMNKKRYMNKKLTYTCM